MEDVPEAGRGRHLLNLRVRVGDRDKALGRLRLAAMGLLSLLEEVRLEDVGLQSAARLARDDEQRLLQVDRVFEPFDLRRVSRIEHVQFREARYRAEGLLE